MFVFSQDLGRKTPRAHAGSEPTGWARLSDLVFNYDREKVEDVKEDVDSLLVFVS